MVIYKSGWGKMEGVYPIHEVKESVQQNTYDKLTSFASKNKVSVNKALITLIEKADEDKEPKKCQKK